MSESDADLASLFADEAGQRIDAIEAALLAIETGNAGPGVVAELFRQAHTIKGAAGMVGLADIQLVAHAVEDILMVARDTGAVAPELVPVLLRATSLLRAQVAGDSPPAGPVLAELAAARNAPTTASMTRSEPPPAGPASTDRTPAAPVAAAGSVADQAASAPAGGAAGPAGPATPGQGTRPGATVRVPAEKIDRVLDLVGEVTLHHRRVAHSVEETAGLPDDITRQLGAERQLLGELKDSAVRMRTLPVAAITGALPRAVRDLARSAGKKVEFTVTGAETELDRVILESLTEPLTHLLRNAVFHGIEPPEERGRAGKPPAGRLELRAVARGSLVEISVRDDGRGIAATTAQEAEREGSLTEILARPGYSTAGEVTDLAGRGVGLDAVQAYARSVGGSLETHSQPGQGLTATLVLPLALAQLEVLLLRRGRHVYGIPISAVDEVVRVTTTQSLRGRPSIDLRGHAVPVTDIAAVLGLSAPPLPPNPSAVIISAGGRRVAAQCDRLIGGEEVMVKPLGPLLQVDGCLGATILGDGRIALLIEPGLFTRPEDTTVPAAASAVPAARREDTGDLSEPDRAEEDNVDINRAKILVVEDSATVRELQRSIFEAAGYPVATAQDGRDALAVLRRDPEIALVVSDLEMPGLDGLGLTRAVRADPDRSSLPVIIVTAQGNDQAREQGLAAGADAFMAKAHFDQRELLATVGRLTGH